MSLTQLNKGELRKLADKADVELTKGMTNKEIIEELERNNVTYDFYKKTILDVEAEEEQEETAAPLFTSGQVLLKMERKNPTFEVYGYRFTQLNPFNLIDENTAQQIIDSYEGFRVASPAEAKSFYS